MYVCDVHPNLRRLLLWCLCLHTAASCVLLFQTQGGGECVISPMAWSHVSEFFEFEEKLHGGFVRLKRCIKQMRRVNKLKMLKAMSVCTRGDVMCKAPWM